MTTTTLLAQITAILMLLSGILIGIRKLVLSGKAGKLDQKSELDAAIKMGASIREELRKDNELLRTRVAILEEHINILDKEVAALKKVNDNYKEEKDDLNAQIRILKLALSKNGKNITLDSSN